MAPLVSARLSGPVGLLDADVFRRIGAFCCDFYLLEAPRKLKLAANFELAAPSELTSNDSDSSEAFHSRQKSSEDQSIRHDGGISRFAIDAPGDLTEDDFTVAEIIVTPEIPPNDEGIQSVQYSLSSLEAITRHDTGGGAASRA